MTNADVEAIIELARARGIIVPWWRAAAYLGARELLAKDPGHLTALAAVKNFTQLMATGEPANSFAEFAIGWRHTDEEIAAGAKV